MIFRTFSALSQFYCLPGATRFALLSACPWLSYSAPLALRTLDSGFKAKLVRDGNMLPLLTNAALAGSAKTMKKTLARKKRSVNEGILRPEYRFDYSKSKPNRFAAKMVQGSVAAVEPHSGKDISRKGEKR